MSFSGHVLNMTNGEGSEHQYRVDKNALYTHQLTVYICMWALCAMLSVPLFYVPNILLCDCRFHNIRFINP